jgi:phage-related tail protein
MQVTENFKITDWQAASHLYHGNGVGVNPEDFGITQAELIKIQDEGFIKYVQRGNKLPSIEHVRSYQKSLKDICLDPSTDRRDDSEYYNPHGVTPTTAFKNGRYLVCFNQTTRDLITGDKQRRGTINKFDQTNKIGSKKWIDKWSKKSN